MAGVKVSPCSSAPPPSAGRTDSAADVSADFIYIAIQETQSVSEYCIVKMFYGSGVGWPVRGSGRHDVLSKIENGGNPFGRKHGDPTPYITHYLL